MNSGSTSRLMSTPPWRNPTVNAYGRLYGSAEFSTDAIPILDPVKNIVTAFIAPAMKGTTFARASHALAKPVMPSAYWGDEVIWNAKTSNHNPMFDEDGRVWFAARVRDAKNPAFCQKGSDHPSAKLTALGAPRLAELLTEASTGDANLKRRLRLELAAEAGPDRLAAEIDKRIGALATARVRVSWRKRGELIRDLETHRRMIVDRLAPADARAAFARLIDARGEAPNWMKSARSGRPCAAGSRVAKTSSTMYRSTWLSI